MTKDEVLREVERLKREKPKNWKFLARNALTHLWHQDHPWTVQHTDEYGRKASPVKFSSCPAQDRFDDESEP